MAHLSGENETAIAGLVKQSAAAKTQLRICSGGTRSSIGNPVMAETVLDTSKNTGIVTYEPGSLHMVARAGTGMAEIEKALAAENQMLAFEPMDHRSLLGSKGGPTIGGIVAGNLSGPRRFLAGACRDHVLGVRFVNGAGDVVKSGGRVMKNVTGLDLAKLQCGAWGTLGVLSEVSLKTLPRPETGITLSIHDINAQEAVELFASVLKSPYEVSGAAWVEGSAHLRLEGLDIQVKARAGHVMDLLQPNEIEKLSGKAHAQLWTDMRDVKHFAGRAGEIWRLSIKPTDAPIVLSRLENAFDFNASLDWGGGLVWLALEEGAVNSAEVIRREIDALGGHATLIRADEEKRAVSDVFHPQPKRLSEIAAQLRRQFDPAGIFNPGIMAAEE